MTFCSKETPSEAAPCSPRLPDASPSHTHFSPLSLRSAAATGHEERSEVRGEEDGPAEGGEAQRPVGFQAADVRRDQG